MSTKTVEIVETVEFKNSVYQFRSDGLIIIRINNGAYIKLEDTKEEFDFMRSKPDYLPMVALIYAGKNTNISKEVRDFINTEEARVLVEAEAVITDSLAHKIIINLIGKIYSHPINIKIFQDDEKGEEWLLPYLEQKEY